MRDAYSRAWEVVHANTELEKVSHEEHEAYRVGDTSEFCASSSTLAAIPSSSSAWTRHTCLHKHAHANVNNT